MGTSSQILYVNPVCILTSIGSHSGRHLIFFIYLVQARIALERRRFLEDAATAVRRQGVWCNMAHDITAEYRSLCAEEVPHQPLLN